MILQHDVCSVRLKHRRELMGGLEIGKSWKAWFGFAPDESRTILQK